MKSIVWTVCFQFDYELLVRALAACTAAAITPQHVRGLRVRVELSGGEYGFVAGQAELCWQRFSACLSGLGYPQADMVSVTFDLGHF